MSFLVKRQKTSAPDVNELLILFFSLKVHVFIIELMKPNTSKNILQTICLLLGK